MSEDEESLRGKESDDDSANSDLGIPSSSVSKSRMSFKEDKRFKKGIVYLSFVPPGMTQRVIKHLLSKYGEIGRTLLQPAKTAGLTISDESGKKKKRREYSEGWVEFLKKKTAKQVAAMLNNTQIGGKKKNKFHDYIWNIKYLSRFKWVHLSERMEYERAVYKQRMLTEVSQAKKIASHFIDRVEASERQQHIANRRLKKGITDQPEQGENQWLLSTFFKQKQTDQEKRAKQKNKKNHDREKFLNKIFT